VAEAITTLDAGLGFFGRAETAFAFLESFFQVALPEIDSAVLDPLHLQVPDQVTQDRAVIQRVIEEIESEPRPKRRFLVVTEREFDLTDPQARWDYTRLAYCSNQATVWSRGRRTTYFEVADQYAAMYWLPDSLKAAFFAQLTADGWEIPSEWLAAIAKEPKPWWRRGV
jgi:hypothetical protein